MRRIVLIALGIIAAAPLAADTLRLAWDHPMRDVVAYHVYCGADPAARVTAPPYVMDKTNWSGSCAVTALNAVGQESERSVSTGVVRCVDGVCSVPPNSLCVVAAPSISYIVAPNGTYTTRPLYDRPGGARIGSVEIKMPDGTPRACEGGAALLVTTSGEWRYTTNNAGLRGAALCRRP